MHCPQIPPIGPTRLLEHNAQTEPKRDASFLVFYGHDQDSRTGNCVLPDSRKNAVGGDIFYPAPGGKTGTNTCWEPRPKRRTTAPTPSEQPGNFAGRSHRAVAAGGGRKRNPKGL